MDSDAVQVDTWVTLAEAAKLLRRSEKTLRRWIATGDLDKEAVRREDTVGGFRYMLRRDAVEKLVGAKARTDAGDLDGAQAALSTLLDGHSERMGKMLQEHAADLKANVEGAVQASEQRQAEHTGQVVGDAVQGLQEQQAEALGALLELIEAQAGQLTELRRELQAERERRGWWARLFGSRERGGDR